MIETLLQLVIYLLVLGIIFWLVYYLLGVIPVPEPFAQVIRIVLVVIAVIVVIYVLLGLVGSVPRLGRL